MQEYHSRDRHEVMTRLSGGGDLSQSMGADGKAATAIETKPLVVISGFMGTGKSTVGRELATILGLPFFDTDRLISERAGCSIAQIFAESGEERFRALEKQLCTELATGDPAVIATGGGTLLDKDILSAFLDAGELFLLEAEPETILKRVGTDNSRPLLSGNKEEQIRQLLSDRQPFYRQLPNRIRTDEKSAEQIAAHIAAMLELPATILSTTPPARVMESEILIGAGLLTGLGSLLVKRNLDTTIYLMIAKNVRLLFLDRIAASLDLAGLSWHEIPIRDGDSEKHLDQAGELLASLAAMGAARDSVAVTVGGGVTGDLGGLAASIYMRGMKFVQVPTTLLAQVDASIGGKVGINLPSGKNLVGNFYQPRMVISDPCLLTTLPEREIAGGMAEVIKTAILGSPDLYAWLEEILTGGKHFDLYDMEFLGRCVSECARIKAAVVERDPFEAGERRILNLGHTVGHALETISGYTRLTHGEAVSIGLVVASRMAMKRGMISTSFYSSIKAMLSSCGLPVKGPEFDPENLLRALHMDKKKVAGRLHFVFPTEPGCCVVVNDVIDNEVLEALQEETT